MSLDKLVFTGVQDWSELEVDVLQLIDPAFTPEFPDWLDARGYRFPNANIM